MGTLYDGIRILRVFFGLSSYFSGVSRFSRVSFPLIGTVTPPPPSKRTRVWRLILLGIGDLVFALLSALLFSVFLYAAASGCFRWFYLLGCGIGFFGYYFTLGKLLILSSETLVFLFRVLFWYLLWILCLPLRFFWWLTGLFAAHCVQPIVRKIRYRLALRYTRRVRAQLSGFIRFSDFS